MVDFSLSVEVQDDMGKSFSAILAKSLGKEE